MKWIVGIDWANDSHQVELQNEDGTVEWNRRYQTTVGALHDLRDDLLEHCDEVSELKVGIEDPTRPVVRVLLEAEIEVSVITPTALDGVRPAYSEAEAKQDELDAHIICDELRVHDNIFYRLEPQKPVITALSRRHRALQNEKQDVTRFSNRLRATLKSYFPQFLELDWDLKDRVMLDLLELIPTPAAAEEVTIEEVDAVLGRCRKHTATEVLEILGGNAPPLPDRVADVDGESARRQAEKLRSAVEAEAMWEQELTELLEEISRRQKAGELPSAQMGSNDEGGHEASSNEEPTDSEESAARADVSSETANEETGERVSDVEIALSVKGLGIRTVAGLFAEGFQALVSLDREMLRRQSIAPVTKQTGKQSSNGDGPDPQIHRRYARNRYLTDTMHQIGDSLQRQNDHYRANYVMMKEEKQHTHGRACRQLTDQFLRVLFAMLRDRTMYDSNLHGATRR